MTTSLTARWIGVSAVDVPADPEFVLLYQDAFAAPQQFGARAQLVHTAILLNHARPPDHGQV